MIRGTTAVFKFKLSFPKANADWITIKFWQTNNPVLSPIIKTEKDCVTGADGFEYVHLTAQETARFSDKYKAKMQMRAKNKITGETTGCLPRLITVYPMGDEIINVHPDDIPAANDAGMVVFDGGAIIES